LIQKEANHHTIAEELDQLLNNKAYREEMLAQYKSLHERMGLPGASTKVAQYILRYLQQGTPKRVSH